MGTHTITEDELSDSISEDRQKWTRFAGSFGEGSNKALEYQIGEVWPLYRVTNHGRPVYIGAMKETAVREYNALP